MQTKRERIKELELKNLELSRRLDSTKRHLDFAERAVRDRNEKIVELRGQIEELKETHANTVWQLADYVAFYERVKTVMEAFEEEKDKPKIMAVDLTNQPEPELTDFCNFVASIVDKIVGEENG